MNIIVLKTAQIQERSYKRHYHGDEGEEKGTIFLSTNWSNQLH